MDNKALPKSHRLYIFIMLIFVGGFLGGFTHEYRGGVFSNAQTGNVLLLSVSLCKGNYSKAFNCLMSLVAYTFGAFISERVVAKKLFAGRFKWETVLVGVEIIVICLLAFLPESTPYIFSQISINIIAAMQYNTFKTAGEVGMATTFCTNHVRNMGVSLEKLTRTGDKAYGKRAFSHIAMISSFAVGVAAATLSGAAVGGKCLLLCAAVMAVVFLNLIFDDIKTSTAAVGRR